MTLELNIEEPCPNTTQASSPFSRSVSGSKSVSGANGRAKRGFDIAASLLILVFTLPLLVVIGALIWLQDRQNIIYKQLRCGRNGKPFYCYKFRTMDHNAPETLENLLSTYPELQAEWEATQKLRYDPRITRFGRFLRKSSLDELPQIFNILKGDMSIVGPRPVIYAELSRYKEEVAYYKAVRPGITGLWQINGRNQTTYEERVSYDREYVSNWHFGLDMLIILKTVPVVLMAKGAY